MNIVMNHVSASGKSMNVTVVKEDAEGFQQRFTGYVPFNADKIEFAEKGVLETTHTRVAFGEPLVILEEDRTDEEAGDLVLPTLILSGATAKSE